jgi:hypothetical protein
MKQPIAVGSAILAFVLATIAPLRADTAPVHVVVFTHVEDNTPGGILGTPQSRQSYSTVRGNLIAMQGLAESYGVQWTLQPDWKLLEAALLYEDSTLRATTNGKNFLRYLKEDRGVAIDPHSHENGGYNYTDIAHLLDSLGVGSTTVIGGHVWDPSLPQFAEWDRFRVPVQGQHYPNAWWRGDILIGSGTPDHVNDPLISGVWRPRDRDHYFEHDPAGNIAAVGQYKHSVQFISELIELYRSGAVPPTVMLTFSCNVNPMTLGAPGGLASVEDTVIAPIAAWRDSGLVLPTDFTTLIDTWLTTFGGASYVYDANAPFVGVSPGTDVSGLALAPPAPNPLTATTHFRYRLARPAHVRLSVFDVRGREVAVVVDGPRSAGDHIAAWDARPHPRGVYMSRLAEMGPNGVVAGSSRRQKVVVVR